MRLPQSGRWAGGIAVAAALVAACVGLVDGLQPDPDLTNRLRDDAYYEFVWAANVAAGVGPVVSDGVTTSGVQLLWSLLLVPIVWGLGAAALPVMAPWCGFALHVVTAGIWWRGTRDRVTGACLALCWLGHPLLVRESQNGQETALACAALAALWLRRHGSLPAFSGLSLLVVLARSDLLVFVAAVSVWRYGWSWRAVVAPAVALTVHTAANLVLGGGWLPDSALPMAWLWHENQALVDGGTEAWLRQSWWFLRPVLLGGPWALASAMGLGFAAFTTLRCLWPASLRALPALGVGCASALGVHDLATAAWTALWLALFPAARRRRPHAGRALLLAAAVALLALHWVVRWYPRDYYVAPVVVVAWAALQPFGRWRVLLVLFAVAQIHDRGRIAPEPLAGQTAMWLAGRFVADVVPASQRVACFNSGLVTFHAAIDVDPASARRRRIVNLDGVVDARAFAALRQRRLDAWLDQQGIACVLDNPVQFALDPRLPHACGHWFGEGFAPATDLVELARFVAPPAVAARPGCDSMRLYWRRRHGDPPPPPDLPRDLGPGPRGGRCILWPARGGQVLEVEAVTGTRQQVVTVDADTTVVLGLAAAQMGTGRLFVRGEREPLLVLPKL